MALKLEKLLEEAKAFNLKQAAPKTPAKTSKASKKSAIKR